MAHDVRYDEDEPTSGQLEAGRTPKRAVNRLPLHGEVLGEIQQIRVAVRNQMDGIRPIEQAVLTYEWLPPSPDPEGGVYEQPGRWLFRGLETVVQGLDGALKPGTVLTSGEWHMLGPGLGWAFDIVHAHWPRG